MKSKVKTVDGIEEITAYNVKDCAPYLPELEFSCKRRNKTTYLYANDFMTLDTETSHDGETLGWIYQWAVKISNVYIYGRKPTEFVEFLKIVKENYGLTRYKQILIYIHNMSYDICYLKRYLKEYDEKIDMLCTDTHTVLLCDVFGFRFICSYKLSNLSLDLFSRNYAKRYRKAVGEIDYDAIRYQDSELLENEWVYQFSDVAAQYDAIEGYIKTHEYQYAHQAPYTATGFVRVDCRKASEKAVNWRRKFLLQKPSFSQYKLMRAAFMGGLTVANYRIVGETIRSDKLRHLDFTSSYPARLYMDYFPKGNPMDYGDIDDMDEFIDVLETYCCVFIASFYDLKIKVGVTCPYIPSSKAIYSNDVLKLNGKVVSASVFSMALTEIDYKIINKQYDFSGVAINDLTVFQRGQCPDFLKRKVMQYFEGKCKLKKSDPRLYMAQKQNLNSIYGMCCTAICRPEYKINEDMVIEEKETDQEKQFERFYHSYNSFLPYVYGIYCTAHARDALIRMIECVGYDNFLYCDTDSVFYLETDENKKKLDEMNEETRKRAIAAGAYVDDNYLGYATKEAPLRAFRALHAKCYAAEELDDKTGEYELKVTIAGIPKKTTKWINGEPVTMTNAEELESIDNLKDGFIFNHCGGTRIVYNEDEARIISINGHVTEIASSAIILPIEKEISETMYTKGKDYSILNVQTEQIIE